MRAPRQPMPSAVSSISVLAGTFGVWNDWLTQNGQTMRNLLGAGVPLGRVEESGSYDQGSAGCG